LLREDEEGVVVASFQDTRLGVVADESSREWSVFVGVANAFVRCMTAPKRVLLFASSADLKSLLERVSLFRLLIPKALVSEV
jgi:N12 class adenine-specific DNA methylase